MDFSPLQYGYQNAIAPGLWFTPSPPPADQSLTLGGHPLNAVGLRYDLSSVDWPGQVLTENPGLTITVGTSRQLKAYSYVRRMVNPAFANGNLPLDGVDRVALRGSGLSLLGEVAGVGSLSLPLDAGVLMALLGAELWDGVLSLLLVSEDTSTFTVLVGDLSLETVWNFTGHNTSRPRNSRADLCPKCGGPVFREQLVMDGYTRILVCQDCWDPPDLTGRSRKRPIREINP